jgi:hypothetical protein
MRQRGKYALIERPVPRILKVSLEGVDDFERTHAKSEAAHGPDRVTTFSGRKRNMSSPLLSIHAGKIEASRGGPPPEVLEQMTTALQIHEQMREEGRELRFQAPRAGGRVGIELCGSDGATAQAVSIREAFDMAAETPGS